MSGYVGQSAEAPAEAGWTDTGDLVEMAGDRVRFLARESDVINVGGAKVGPIALEDALRASPGIAELRVYGKRSSLVGAFVAVDLVLAPGAQEATAKAGLLELAKAKLRSHEIPRLIRIVPELKRTASGKIIRGLE